MKLQRQKSTLPGETHSVRKWAKPLSIVVLVSCAVSLGVQFTSASVHPTQSWVRYWKGAAPSSVAPTEPFDVTGPRIRSLRFEISSFDRADNYLVVRDGTDDLRRLVANGSYPIRAKRSSRDADPGQRIARTGRTVVQR